MSGDPMFTMGCRCPASWMGVVPPPCPVHNPGAPVVTTSTTLPTNSQTVTIGPPSVPVASGASEVVTKVIDMLSRLGPSDRDRVMSAVKSFFQDAADVRRIPLGGPAR